MKRIFVAIPISQNLQERILEWGKKYQSLLVRWLKGKNLHVTLVPPWETDDIKVVSSKLKVVSSQPFEISFSQISFGPNSREPRLIWASGQTPQEIYDLRFMIYEVLGQKPENQEFKLHITLARFRPGEFRNFPVKELNEKVDWREEIKSFVLMESHLSSAGADYEVLHSFALN